MIPKLTAPPAHVTFSRRPQVLKDTAQSLWDGWKRIYQEIGQFVTGRDRVRGEAAEAYDKTTKQQILHDAETGLALICSCSPAVIPQFTRAWIRDCIDRYHPNYRRSAFRALVEGALTPDLAKPLRGLKPDDARVRVVLRALDLLETIAHEQELREFANVQDEAERAARADFSHYYRRRPGDPAPAGSEDAGEAAAGTGGVADSAGGSADGTDGGGHPVVDGAAPSGGESGASQPVAVAGQGAGVSGVGSEWSGTLMCLSCGEDWEHSGQIPNCCPNCKAGKFPHEAGAPVVRFGSGRTDEPLPAPESSPAPMAATAASVESP